MSLVIPDLTQDVVFRGVSLNDVTEVLSGKTKLVGNSVQMMDVAPPELRQFTEPNALVNGLDYGGVWQGARLITIQGVTYDLTRGQTYDRLSLLEAVSLPVSSTFGIYPLTFYAISGSGGSPVLRTVNVRPNGLRIPVNRDGQGGKIADAIGISWTITFVAMNPSIS